MNYNKTKTILVGVVSSCILLACAPKKKAVVSTPVVEPPKIQMPKIEPPKGNLVPFTRELFFKMRDRGVDIKKLIFYVDKTIVLNKITNNSTMEVGPDGILIERKGLADNTLLITPLVGAMIESVESDGVRLNFGRAGSTLKFINNNASPKFFIFQPDKVDKMGNNEVTYNNSTYKAGSEGGGAIGEVKLMIKQLDEEIGDGKGKVEPGVGGKSNLNGY
ncbi:MAG: hypothetical protein NTZ59_05405 [Bacteroidetes bacterium]|jgi:hypothetical protein|nr:hypothetical protein [Bacteroidota bacterium]